MKVEHEILDRIRQVVPQLAEDERQCIAERRLTAGSAKLLRETGVMRTLQPRPFGGFEADPRIFNQAMYELGRASSSAGWVTGVVGIHSWHLGLYDERAQREVWGEDADTWISSSYGPAGRAKPVAGGYELSGRWGFSSGSDHSSWTFVGGLCDDGSGALTYRHFLLPRSDYEIVDVWNANGLTGTGSNDIVIDKAFVPEYRSMDVEELYRLNCPGRALNSGPLYSIPWYSIFLNAIVMPLVGMAQRALDECLAPMRERAATDSKFSIRPATLARLAEASSEVDLARLVLQYNLGELYETLQAGDAVSMQLRQRAKRDHISAVGLAVSAADKAYLSGGPRSIRAESTLQQVWRDVHAAQHHAMNVPDGILTEVGTYLVTETVVYPS